MLKHSVIDILKSMSIKEVNRLTNFMKSTYFNKSRKILSLYERLIKYYPDFSNKELSRENLGAFLNKDGIHKGSELRDYLSKLLSLIFEFLIIEKLKNRNDSRGLFLLSDLSERDLGDIFDKQYAKFNEEITAGGYELNKFMTDYHLYAQLFNNFVSNTKVRKLQHAFTEISMIDRCALSISIYHYVSLVTIFSSIVIHKRKFSIESDNVSIEDLIDHLRSSIIKFKHYTADELKFIELYNSLYLSYKSMDNISFYKTYKKNFKGSSNILSYEEIKFHNSRHISYCLLQKRVSKDSTKWNEELYELYNQFLEKGFYITKNEKYLSYTLFRDILINAVNYNNLIWLEQYIEEYSAKLHPRFRTNMKRFALSYLYFKKKEFRKSLDYISKINPDYFIYKYDIRNLRLVNYYELNDFVGVMDLIHSYEVALSRDNLIGNSLRNFYKKFLFYLKQLVRYFDNLEELEYFHNKLKSEGRLMFKLWLIEKFDLRGKSKV